MGFEEGNTFVRRAAVGRTTEFYNGLHYLNKLILVGNETNKSAMFRNYTFYFLKST